MKTAAKAFLIIDIVISSILLIYYIAAWSTLINYLYNQGLIYYNLDWFLGFCVAFFVASIVIGGITLYKLSNASSRDGMVVWGVLSLIFCGIVSGILILCMKDEDYSGYKYVKVTTYESPNKPSSNYNQGSKDNYSSLSVKLEKIEEMKRNGLIDEEEYQALRKKAIENTNF